MNLKDKRTRRITAACASAAVVVGGVTVGATLASASGSLALTTGNAFTALDLGQQVVASQQTLKATTALVAGDHFTLTYGTDTTVSLAGDASRAQVQTALNNLASITAAGGVVVNAGVGADLTTLNDTYLINFNVGGQRPAITVTNAGGNTGTAAMTNTTPGGGLAANLANATFGTKVSTSLTGHLMLTLDSYTAPTGVTPGATAALLFNNSQASGSATGPTASWTPLSTPGSTSAVSAAFGTPGSVYANDTFLTATQPGTYTFHFSDDENTVGTGDDAVSPTVTVTVLDSEGATGATSDDWAPAVTAAPTATTYGAPITATVPLDGVSLVDTRSSNSGIGILGSKVAALVGVKFTSVVGALNADIAAGTDYTAPRAVTAAATNATLTLPAGKTGHTGSVVSTATFDRNGDGTLTDATLGSTAATAVDTNGVTSLTAVSDLAATAVTGSVAAAAHTATVKSGTGAVTYSVTVQDAGTKTDDVVQFKLTPGTNTPGLSGTGTLVSSSSGVKTYAVNANSDGVASITVTSDKTTAGTTYSVDASSNNNNATQLVATYADVTASTVKVTSSAAQLSPIVTGSAALKGQLLDQFGAAYVPTGADPRQVSLFLNSNKAALGGANTVTSSATTQMPLAADGSFSYTYTPAATPTAGTQTAFTFAYDKNANGQYNAAEPGVDGNISWASSAQAATITLTTPVNNATGVNLSDHANIVVGQAHALATDFGDANGQITGTVTDSNNTLLAYKTVTITGTAGVYFSTSPTPDVNNPLVTSITTMANGSGAISGVYAFFTKAGTGSITATADSVHKDAAFTTNLAADSYKVTVNSVAGAPGDVLIVTGTVTDAFGNPANNQVVDLDTGTSTLGVLGNPAPHTNAAGLFSTTYTTGTNQNGKATLTATLHGQTANLKAAAGWATAGVTVGDGVYTASSPITVAPDTVALNKIAARLGAGSVKLSGTARPGASVALYVNGVASPFATVTADSTTGVFSRNVSISRNTTFVARTAHASASVTAHVVSTAKISAKVGKNHRVTLTVSGGPSKHATVVLWERNSKGKYVKVGSANTTRGVVSWTVNAGKGRHVFKATYQSSGCDISTAVSISVKS